MYKTDNITGYGNEEYQTKEVMENSVAIKVELCAITVEAPVVEAFWVYLPESGYETKTVEGVFGPETAFKAVVNNELEFAETYGFNCDEEVWLPLSCVAFALNEIEYRGWLLIAEHYGSGSNEDQVEWANKTKEWIANNPGVEPHL